MKWQAALNKTEHKHLRWALNNYVTLGRIKDLREEHATMNIQRAEMGLHSDACHECCMIEGKLKKAGKL
jgi:hypothetical protein